jgi:Tyrosine phosphatase family
MLLLTGASIGWTLLIWSNFGVVVPGELYRSAQMGGASLAAKVREHRIKTVLNLRGSHPESSWYRDERSATLEGGATQIDMPFSSCEWMSRMQARALLEVLETAERPILIHCFHGSERTGMVLAFAVLLRPGSTLHDAEAQFTPFHLYFGLGDGVVTRQHLDRYEEWLRDRSLTHSPDHLRRWLGVEYQPGKPNREQWDHDPYPLVVVTKGVKKLADRR